MPQSKKNVLMLEKAREFYSDFSGKASEISRQLGFVGIALIWVFKVEENGRQSIPNTLLIPGVLIVISLAFDLAHYIISSLLWGGLARIKEKGNITEFVAPRWINWPANFFFWTKLGLMVIAYGFIVDYLLSKFTLSK